MREQKVDRESYREVDSKKQTERVTEKRSEDKRERERLLRSSTWGHHSRAEVPPSIGVGRAKEVTEIAKKTIGPQPKLSLTPEFLEPLRIKSLLAL